MNRVGIMNAIDRGWEEWAYMTLLVEEEGKHVDDLVKGPIQCVCVHQWNVQRTQTEHLTQCGGSGCESDWSASWALIKANSFLTINPLAKFCWASGASIGFQLFFFVTNWKLMQPHVLHKFEWLPSATFSVPVAFGSFVGLPFISMTPKSVFQYRNACAWAVATGARVGTCLNTRLCCLKGERFKKKMCRPAAVPIPLRYNSNNLL